MAQLELSVRPATGADLEAINRIHGPEVLHGTATWDTEPWTLDQRREWFSHHDAMNPVLVAEHQGEVVGFAYVTLVSQKTGWRFTREDTVYIHPAMHRRGLGRALLAPIVESARANGIRSVLAVIEASNTASIALHQRLGDGWKDQLARDYVAALEAVPDNPYLRNALFRLYLDLGQYENADVQQREFLARHPAARAALRAPALLAPPTFAPPAMPSQSGM